VYSVDGNADAAVEATALTSPGLGPIGVRRGRKRELFK